jgi:hypothetical protein
MGGIGSGNWCRLGKKATTDQVRRIDISYMKKQGLLKPNTVGNLKWSISAQPRGEINYICYKDSLLLSFNVRFRGGDWELIEQRISFDRTPCYFGGERLWFLCPNCNKRVGVLYGVRKLFLCRHCYKLPYSSQNSGYIDNLIEQKHKLGERIFEHYEGGEGWCKKKGMHWKTFYRLHDQYLYLEKQWYKYMKDNVSSFMGEEL